MKHLTDHISECLLLERADKFMQNCFGKVITPGAKLLTKFKSLGLDWRHEFDRFIVYENGVIEYSNPRLFGEVVSGRAYPVMLNRVLKPTQEKEFRLVEPLPDVKDLDIKRPLNFLRAVLNAFPQGYIEDREDSLILTDLDYTKGDLEKDNQ